MAKKSTPLKGHQSTPKKDKKAKKENEVIPKTENSSPKRTVELSPNSSLDTTQENISPNTSTSISDLNRSFESSGSNKIKRNKRIDLDKYSKVRNRTAYINYSSVMHNSIQTNLYVQPSTVYCPQSSNYMYSYGSPNPSIPIPVMPMVVNPLQTLVTTSCFVPISAPPPVLVAPEMVPLVNCISSSACIDMNCVPGPIYQSYNFVPNSVYPVINCMPSSVYSDISYVSSSPYPPYNFMSSSPYPAVNSTFSSAYPDINSVSSSVYPIINSASSSAYSANNKVSTAVYPAANSAPNSAYPDSSMSSTAYPAANSVNCLPRQFVHYDDSAKSNIVKTYTGPNRSTNRNKTVSEICNSLSPKISNKQERPSLDFYLKLPKTLFPPARILTIDPNPIIDIFCKSCDILDASWILDLEFGTPRSSTKPIPIYDAQYNSVNCMNSPGAIHPEFDRCSQDFKATFLYYYDSIVSTWYKGYVTIENDHSVENFQAFLMLPMQGLGMCWS